MWSRSRFDQDATSLVTALKKQTTGGARDGGRSKVAPSNATRAKKDLGWWLLTDWRLEVDRPAGDIFLSHPSVTSAPATDIFQKADNDEASPPRSSDGEEDDPFDDTIFIDTAQVHVPMMDDGANTITWYFSVVYSETYQVPVLYFHAQHTTSGEPCSRAHVVRNLFPSGDPTTTTIITSDDSWEFVSQEPHPHTGFPSYFLHPCRTSERIQLLRQGDDKDDDDDDDTVHYLWAWMSMMLPAVGFPIPAQFYRTVQASLCGTQPTSV